MTWLSIKDLVLRDSSAHKDLVFGPGGTKGVEAARLGFSHLFLLALLLLNLKSHWSPLLELGIGD